MTKTIKFIAALMSLASAMCLAQPQAHAAVAPLNPDYVEYMERQAADGRPAARSLAANSTENQQNHPVGGYVPSPLNWSHLDGKTWSLPQYGAVQSGGTALARSAANSADALPSKYDLRSEIPPVRNQTAFNNCWTHSAMAATESNLIQKALADTSIDLSEWYLTYYALNPYGNMPGFTNASEEPYYYIGGNDWKAVALLARGTGSVTTAKAPDITSTLYDYSRVYAPAVSQRDYKLVNALYLGDFATGKEQWEVQLSAARRDMIKRAITQYGVVSVGIHMGDMDSSNYNEETGAYYFGLHLGDVMEGVDKNNDGKDDIVATDHAVAIVGWDDDYSRENFAEVNRPQSDGAWIIRNSWGENWGDGGYCYVSYEEGTLCDGVAYDSETARAGENVYQYDPLGCVTWYVPGDPDEAGNVLYFANVFTAEGDDAISSVAFYVPDEGMTYDIRVYTDCGADSPVSGTPAPETTSAGSLVPGYNTVTLDKPVEVAAGTRFSVVVKAVAAEGGYELLAPVENFAYGGTENAAANPGEGWLSIDGENFYDIIQLFEDEGMSGTNPSICLKAFGERVYTASDAPAPVMGDVTVSGGAAEASVSLISEEKNDEAQSGVISALETESVEGIAPQKNVALLGAFSMSVAHGGGSASFTIKLAEEMYFEGTPYVIIQNKNGELYRAFRAEYSGKALTFTVDALDDYFSEAIITIADVKDSAKPAPHGGSGGGCSAGWGALALFAVVPLALKKKTK